ncbi:MAG TPA: phytoene desaturase family protein [Actinomycetes bacterium]|nr:phytoene desaturase family protein [Actinomycetes bacterium]
MRTVTGRTDHVVVIGAGLGGLSATMELLGSSRRVTVCEQTNRPGGRAGLIEDAGYRFDTGPTVLTMPRLIEDAFASIGEDMADWVTLRALDPLYRAWFADGSSLDVLSDRDAMADQIADALGPRQAEGYRKYVEFVSRLYQYQIGDFIDRNIDSPFALLTPNLARLAVLGAFGRMAPTAHKYLDDPRLERLFTFQAMYAGMSPFDALAIYCVISYMDTIEGVYAPLGGMHSVPAAMADAAQKHGADFRYDTEVVHIERRGRRAVAVHTAHGERIACDAVVVNSELPHALNDLLGEQPRRRLRSSPSCVLLLAGSQTSYSKTVHHNIHFGGQWKSIFDDVISRGQLMSDPSFLVSRPTASDAGLAPPDREIYYALFPTPNTTASLDWTSETDRYRDRVIQTLEERGYVGFADAIETEHVISPADWERLGMPDGSPFSLAHSFWQTGPFRPRNIWGDNIVFAGCSTIPGVGIPMVLISGRLATQRITGVYKGRR